MNCPPRELQPLLDNCLEQSRLLAEAAQLLTEPAAWVDVAADREQKIERFKALTARLLELQRRYEEQGHKCHIAGGDGKTRLAEAERTRRQAFQSAMDALKTAVAQTETSKAALLQSLGATNHTQEMLSAYYQK